MRRSMILSALVAASLVALVGCGGAKENVTPAAPAAAPATDKAPAPAPAAPEVKANKIGETVTLNGVKFTVNSVRVTPNNGDKKANDGYTYMIAEATVENTGTVAFQSNSLVQYSLKISTGMLFDRFAHKDLKAPLDGPVAPGAKLTGEIAFMVPVDAQNAVVSFMPDLLKMDNVARVNLGNAK
jgi:hypothetical protein